MFNSLNSFLRYYISATQPGTGRDPYYIVIPDAAQIRTTSFTPVSIALNSEKNAYFSASLSPLCGYYLLSYEGPDVPWQKLVDVDDIGQCQSNYFSQRQFSKWF